MAWKYDAEDIIPSKLTTFVPVNLIFIFSTLLILVLILLFPKIQVLKTLATMEGAYPISIVYLQGLIEEEPDNFYYRFLLTSQDIALGNWRDAANQLYFLKKNAGKKNAAFQIHILWLSFDLNLNLAYQKKVGSSERIESEDKAYRYLQELIPLETNQRALSLLATGALGLNHPETALVIYQKLLSLYPVQGKTMLAQIARTALMSRSYQLSGDLYFKAAHMASTVPETREYILLGLKAYQSNNLFDAGFIQLQAFTNPAIINTDMAMFLTRYALAGNRPDMADKYMRQILSSSGESEQPEVSSLPSDTMSAADNKQGEI